MDGELELLLNCVKPESIRHVSEMRGIGCGGVLDGRLLCDINPDRNPDEWEEIRTILHELLHDHSKFKERVGLADPKGEQEIDDEGDRVLRENPEVAGFLLMKLREAKFLQIKESIVGRNWRTGARIKDYSKRPLIFEWFVIWDEEGR